MKTIDIPLMDLHALHAPILSELRSAFDQALDRSAFIQGESVRAFERDFGAWCQTGPGAGCANGTDAIFLALRALGIGPGDVVAVPALTFAATAEAVVMAGATPLFVDVDPRTMTIDPARLATSSISVKAVVAVHLHGQIADMDALGAWCRERGAFLIEDSAQAHGATWHGKRAGSIGDAAAFSFYPGKNLGALGDAGMVLGQDARIVDRARFLADHGREGKYNHLESAYNMRMDSLQAAFLSLKLKHLEDWNRNRARIAEAYCQDLSGCPGLVLPWIDPRGTSAWHLFVVRHRRRDAIATFLRDEGIETGIHYPTPLHELPAFSKYADGSLPVAQDAAKTALSIPIHPHLQEVDRVRVATALRRACEGIA